MTEPDTKQERAKRDTVEAAATKGEVSALYFRVQRLEVAVWALAIVVALRGLASWL